MASNEVLHVYRTRESHFLTGGEKDRTQVSMLQHEFSVCNVFCPKQILTNFAEYVNAGMKTQSDLFPRLNEQDM